jgi:hypothetical protein
VLNIAAVNIGVLRAPRMMALAMVVMVIQLGENNLGGKEGNKDHQALVFLPEK